ncbi:hypothetical protein [Streptomyces typhae]|uniref:hypothetical protein n=1 Tax=Streptomyces typhae TaxID=2681492 RepID=UPI001FE4F016|nr:hypothetical protein [Streptomyces typhae]
MGGFPQVRGASVLGGSANRQRWASEVGDRWRVHAALSGRSLIALLISLHSIKHTASDGDGDGDGDGGDGDGGDDDQELAATLYERIDESLTDLTPSGQPVTITLDDRTAYGPPTTASRSADDDGTEDCRTAEAGT